MKLIKKIQKQIDDELCGAKDYIESALKIKDDNLELSNMYYELSIQEGKHYTSLHNQVVNLINKYKLENGEPPVGMLELYNYLHEKEINKLNNIRSMQNLYKEM